jgi:hypothetical protein
MQRHWENCTAVSTMCGAGILYDEQTPQALAATIRHGLHVDPEDIARLVKWARLACRQLRRQGLRRGHCPHSARDLPRMGLPDRSPHESRKNYQLTIFRPAIAKFLIAASFVTSVAPSASA